ncbi:MAG: hypothetical protein ABIW46_00350 [Acidimicrobiales bacterium]
MDRCSYTHPDLSARAVIGALVKAGFVPANPRPWRRTVLDTFDGRLHGAGLRLEVRETDGSDLELELTGGGGSAPAHVVVAAAPRIAADLPPGPLRARLAPILDVRALLPVMTVTSTRSTAYQRDAAGRLHVRSSGGQGSHLLLAMALANALALLPDGEGVPEGGTVKVMMLT